MKVIVHDLTINEFQQISTLFSTEDKVFSVQDTPKNCIGCFGCWTKTPGQCVLNDNYQTIGALLAQASEVIMISKCVYGGYSPNIKSVVDRSISFLMPFFVTKKDETHHQQRYRHTFPLQVYFYGEDLSLEEKQIATSLIKANQKNFYFSDSHVEFAGSVNELQSIVQNKEETRKCRS